MRTNQSIIFDVALTSVLLIVGLEIAVSGYNAVMGTVGAILETVYQHLSGLAVSILNLL